MIIIITRDTKYTRQVLGIITEVSVNAEFMKQLNFKLNLIDRKTGRESEKIFVFLAKIID